MLIWPCPCVALASLPFFPCPALASLPPCRCWPSQSSRCGPCSRLRLRMHSSKQLCICGVASRQRVAACRLGKEHVASHRMRSSGLQMDQHGCTGLLTNYLKHSIWAPPHPAPTSFHLKPPHHRSWPWCSAWWRWSSSTGGSCAHSWRAPRRWVRVAGVWGRWDAAVAALCWPC